MTPKCLYFFWKSKSGLMQYFTKVLRWNHIKQEWQGQDYQPNRRTWPCHNFCWCFLKPISSWWIVPAHANYITWLNLPSVAAPKAFSLSAFGSSGREVLDCGNNFDLECKYVTVPRKLQEPKIRWWELTVHLSYVTKIPLTRAQQSWNISMILSSAESCFRLSHQTNWFCITWQIQIVA